MCSIVVIIITTTTDLTMTLIIQRHEIWKDDNFVLLRIGVDVTQARCAKLRRLLHAVSELVVVFELISAFNIILVL